MAAEQQQSGYTPLAPSAFLHITPSAHYATRALNSDALWPAFINGRRESAQLLLITKPEATIKASC